MKVTKRDGSLQKLNKNKIYRAIEKAFISCEYDVDEDSIWDIVSDLKLYNKISVENIQDQIEKTLMDYDFYEVAKAYVIYRHDHDLLRAGNNNLVNTISSKLEANNVSNQNANVDEYSFGGRIGEAGRIVTKEYALENCMSRMSKNNHLNNEIYIHDLDSYAVGQHNCLSIPFDDLLANGFKTRQVDIRPANSINTAFQLLAVIFQIQSLQQFGGVSATHLDWTMVPYVRKSFYKHFQTGRKYIEDTKIMVCALNPDTPIDHAAYTELSLVYKYAMDMTEKELKQAVEGMYHNLNSLQSRSGNQLPFTSINYGTCTSLEGRMVIKALLEGSIKGVGPNHTTPIFPCGIFQYKVGVNNEPGTPNYDLYKLALQSTAKRLYPNYANVDWTGNIGYDPKDPRTYFSTMGK